MFVCGRGGSSRVSSITLYSKSGMNVKVWKRRKARIATSPSAPDEICFGAYWHSFGSILGRPRHPDPWQLHARWPCSIIRYLSARVHLLYHSFMNMCSFICSCCSMDVPSISLRNLCYYIYMRVYILGQSLVSSAAPHLLPIIVNLNQRLVFLLMNRSHLNADSPSVGRRRYCAPSGQRCISELWYSTYRRQKSSRIIAAFCHWLHR